MTFSETFLVFLVTLVVFLGVKFGFRKSCLCKRSDKYEVWKWLLLRQTSNLVQNRIGKLVVKKNPTLLDTPFRLL